MSDIQSGDHDVLRVTIGIIARNEEANIDRTLESLAAQDLFSAPGLKAELIVLANGCTDSTVSVARDALARRFAGKLARGEVVETPIGGKSRAWNILVHEAASPYTDVFLFIDADIGFAYPSVCRELISRLKSDPVAVACTGRPLKQIAVKRRKSILDRMSLTVSEANRHARAINGSLYCARASVLRIMWLPEPTPGEDGFLNAMVQTRGFSKPPDVNLVIEAQQVTHYFTATPIRKMFSHELRMVVGTVVNIWLFEHLAQLESSEPVGPIIALRNSEEPGWVGQVVRERSSGKIWVVPRKLLFWRMAALGSSKTPRNLRVILVGLVATAFSIAVAVAANSRLKQASAAAYW